MDVDIKRVPCVNNTQFFCYSSNGTTHKIHSFINCNTKFVIYLITCTACSIQYVGCTTNPLKSIYHLSDIKREFALNTSSVSKHFKLVHAGDTSSFSFSGIERFSRPLSKGDHHTNSLVENPDGYLY